MPAMPKMPPLAPTTMPCEKARNARPENRLEAKKTAACPIGFTSGVMKNETISNAEMFPKR